MKNVRDFLTRVDQRNITSNTQRVLCRLLHANGGWVQGDDICQTVLSVATNLTEATTARVRDLRKPQFGGFPVECRSARQLHRAGGQKVFFYRILPERVTVKQVAKTLGMI